MSTRALAGVSALGMGWVVGVGLGVCMFEHCESWQHN